MSSETVLSYFGEVQNSLEKITKEIIMNRKETRNVKGRED